MNLYKIDVSVFRKNDGWEETHNYVVKVCAENGEQANNVASRYFQKKKFTKITIKNTACIAFLNEPNVIEVGF